MLFSIVITTHERPLLLRRALDSLARQTHQDFEVIVVDDSLMYVPPYDRFAAFPGRLKYLQRSGVAGPGPSRDLGVRIAESRFTVFLDDDDSFAPGHLQALDQHMPRADGVIGFHDFQVCYEERQHAEPRILRTEAISLKDYDPSEVYVRNRIPNSCVVYPTALLQSLRHDADLVIYEDWDYLLQAVRRHRLQHLPLDSVNIHKSIPNAPENMRRGNSRNEVVAETTLELYRRHPAPEPGISLRRQQFFRDAGIVLDLDAFH